MISSHGVFLLLNFASLCHGFYPAKIVSRRHHTSFHSTTSEKSVDVEGQTNEDGITLVDVRTMKPTGISFLPPSTIQRARENGSSIEKIKLEKDGTSAFVDVYEYAKKIRDGEMTWEEVDKADLDTVRTYHFCAFTCSWKEFIVVKNIALFHRD
jgi:hypothetical protein